MYAPSLASLPDYFGTSAAMVKLTMTLNILAYALCQLVYGPASDRYGRRPVLIGGMLGFALASLACALSQSIEQLIWARTFQGIAGAAEAVVVYAIIRDLYSGTDRIKAIALFAVVFGAAPAVAPLVGGYIHVAFGWRAIFYLLSVLAVLCLALIFAFLPESSKPDASALRASEVRAGYSLLLRNRVFMSYALLTGTGLAAVFAFLTAGPFIFINNFDVPTDRFGVYYLFIVIAYVIGSFLTNRLAHRLSPVTLLWFGVGASLLGAFYVLWVVQSGLESPLTLTIGMCLLFFGAAPLFVVAPARALDATSNRIGYASALIKCTELAMGALAAAAVTVLHDDTSMPMAIVLVAFAVFSALLTWLVGARDPVRTAVP